VATYETSSQLISSGDLHWSILTFGLVSSLFGISASLPYHRVPSNATKPGPSDSSGHHCVVSSKATVEKAVRRVDPRGRSHCVVHRLVFVPSGQVLEASFCQKVNSRNSPQIDTAQSVQLHPPCTYDPVYRRVHLHFRPGLPYLPGLGSFSLLQGPRTCASGSAPCPLLCALPLLTLMFLFAASLQLWV